MRFVGDALATMRRDAERARTEQVLARRTKIKTCFIEFRSMSNRIGTAAGGLMEDRDPASK